MSIFRCGRRRVAITTITVLLLAGLAGLASCSTPQPSNNTGSAPATAPTGATVPTGGTLTVALDGTIRCLDPWQTDVPAENNVYRQVVETLTSIDPENGDLRPWLAESWEVNADATEYTFKLRAGVHFSDGSELTADVIKQNFDQASTLAVARRATSYLTGYVGTEVVDSLTAKVTFDKPNASFLNHSASNFVGILAPSTIATSPEDRCANGIIGTGPFTIDSYSPNQQVVIKARADYDSAPTWAGHSGPAYLDQITYLLVPESSSRLGLITSGQADVAQSIESQDFVQAQAAGVTINPRVTPGVPLRLQFNLKSDVVSEEAVRQAVSYYINREQINDVIFAGTSEPQYSLLTSNTPGAAKFPELLGFDAAKADSILTAAGWAKGTDGFWAKDGKPLSFHISKGSPYSLSTPLLELVVQQLREGGIQADFADITGDFNENMTKHLYDVYFANTTDLDPDVLRGQVSPIDGNRNNLEEGDPIQAPLTAENQIGDWTERSALLADIQEQILTRALQVPIAGLVQFYGVAKTATGIGYDVESRLYLYDAYLIG